MAHLAKAVAALQVVGDELNPFEMTQRLRCEPTTAWAKGDERTFAGVTRTTTFGKWALESDETSPADVDAQVSGLLSRLTNDLTLWAELGDRYDINLVCGWFMDVGNEGVSLRPETMLALGERGILLDLDLYGGDSDKAPEWF